MMCLLLLYLLSFVSKGFCKIRLVSAMANQTDGRRTSRQSRPPSWSERRDGFVAVEVGANDQVNPNPIDGLTEFMKRNFETIMCCIKQCFAHGVKFLSCSRSRFPVAAHLFPYTQNEQTTLPSSHRPTEHNQPTDHHADQQHQ